MVETLETRKQESQCLISLWSICTSAVHGYCVGQSTHCRVGRQDVQGEGRGVAYVCTP
jgi:hypothetical protein